MPFIPVPNTVQAELRFLSAGQRFENILYFQPIEELNVPQMLLLATSLAAWWSQTIASVINANVRLNEVYITDLTTASSPTLTYVPPTPLTGLNNSPVLPFNVAPSVSFRTLGRGRSSRGRNYITGLCEDEVQENSVIQGVADTLVEGYNNLLDPANIAQSFEWGVVSRFTGKAPRAQGLFQPIVSAVMTDLFVDSQRRRLPGRGQ